MLNKKFMILIILIAGLLAVSAVSAADNASDIIGVEETTDEVVSVDDNQVILEENGNDVELLPSCLV